MTFLLDAARLLPIDTVESGCKVDSDSSLEVRYHTGYLICFLARSRSVSHTIRAKTKLLNRVRRIRGQIEALERALEGEKGCADAPSRPLRHAAP
jgi:hypothetical protein